ncbi:trihelix transcription factor ASR3-like [Zingiber officinale]|uniref:trihelix transcription factor ASR3-like n=1 Tax=Zingiber officinale TaxID=94328 RepID=UPI001C4D5286|nr:trihelix transcription factor ASR3-like [Zingiber officinale]
MDEEYGGDCGGGNGRNPGGGDGGDTVRCLRRHRWTKNESIVMLEGKRAVEGRGREPFVTMSTKRKWDAVSSYCRQKGTDRSPKQCRKRWGILVTGYNKIRAWETKHAADPSESFWEMTNGQRKRRLLPGVYDDVLYSILEEDKEFEVRVGDFGESIEEGELEVDEDEAAFLAGGQNATESGSFSDVNQANLMKNKPSPITATLITKITNDKLPANDSEDKSLPPGRKHWQTSEDEVTNNNPCSQQTEVLGRNNSMTAQLDAQNLLNIQLNGDQWREHANRLLTVLDKVTDVLGKFADKP